MKKAKLILAALVVIAGALLAYLPGLREEAWRRLQRSIEARTAEATAVEVSRTVELERLSVPVYTKAELQKLAKQICEEENFPYPVIEVIIEKESYPAWNQFSVRREPSKIEKFGEFDGSSWGLTQIIPGYWRDTCGFEDAQQLLNPEIAIRCSIQALRATHKQHGGKGPIYDQLWNTFRRYNGTNEDSKRYADNAIAMLQRKLIDGVRL